MPLTFLLPKERESFDKVHPIEEWEIRQYFYLTSGDKRSKIKRTYKDRRRSRRIFIFNNYNGCLILSQFVCLK